jgi:hypothetical protein
VVAVVAGAAEVEAAVEGDRTGAANADADDRPKTYPAETAKVTREVGVIRGPRNRVEACWKCTPTGMASFEIPRATIPAK